MGVVLPQASSGAAELAAAQTRSAGQLQVLESQLASKDAALEASQVRLAALEAELKSAHSKVRRAGGFGPWPPTCAARVVWEAGRGNTDT